MGKPTGASKSKQNRGRKTTGGIAQRGQLETRGQTNAHYQNRPGPTMEQLQAASQPSKCEEDCELDDDEE
ncbi:unnamed protein product [Rhizoctonia solani]|uniref:Uncharacterized protein n=1 Tax=Rhizoctonia solani TaxID=456999 RepID=A0A8H3DVQ2_9AGAM|nr:unnamed protein product [Rhizoctonia solani]